MATFIVTDKNIQEILEKYPIVILDFWADWCGPCKVFSPIFERVSDKFPDLFFGKINTETQQLLCQDFEIRSIPTLAILKERELIFFESGSIPEYALTSIVEKAKTIDLNSLDSDNNED